MLSEELQPALVAAPGGGREGHHKKEHQRHEQGQHGDAPVALQGDISVRKKIKKKIGPN